MMWSRLLAALMLSVFTDNAMSACPKDKNVCEYWLEVESFMTMMDYKTAVYASGGKLYHFNVTNTTLETHISDTNVITADGWENQRLVIAVNKTIPGPTIECPILPGQTFTYRFVADPKGTFWYHAHTGTQLSMGLLGPFIVRENQSMPMGEEMGEHIMMLQDWNHDMDAELLHHKMLYGNFENRTRVEFTGSLEGGNFSMFKFHSGLINGKGRYFKPDGTFIEAPLSVFTVEQSKSYRFRVIGAGNLYPFRVSIDGHPLKIVATDGNELDPLLVESFIINPGERYDFVVVANQSIDNYWIRGETLEVNVKNHTALAIFRYANAPDTDPLTKRRQCLQSHK
uniref:Plastocyanin-like domain-containing protein n=1 Tax=Biomphalaria glabrata TaxID=6526 RepID=A0A2C9JW58_BIOGL